MKIFIFLGLQAPSPSLFKPTM